MGTALTTSSASARRRLVKSTSAPKGLRRSVSSTSLWVLFLLLWVHINWVFNYFLWLDFGWKQALGIKGKMIAKKNYAEKAQMKKTLVLSFTSNQLCLISIFFILNYRIFFYCILK